MDLDSPFGNVSERRYKRSERLAEPVNKQTAMSGLPDDMKASTQRKQEMMKQFMNMQGQESGAGLDHDFGMGMEDM